MKDKIVIRDFRADDLYDVASIFAEAFRDDMLKIIRLSEEDMVDFLIDTREVFPLPYEGYFVAESSGETVGIMALRWKGQKRPKVRFEISKVIRYGLSATIKILFERFLFPERPRRGSCHISELAVKSTWRGRGIGAQLIGYGKSVACDIGLKKYTLNVDISNDKARKLYRDQGFRVGKKTRNLLARWLLGTRDWYSMSQDICKVV